MYAKYYNQLKKPFPLTAYSTDSSRGFNLTSLKAQHVPDRLNTVLGIDGWDFHPAFDEKDTGVICHGELTIKAHVPLDEGKLSLVKMQIRKVRAVGFSALKKNLGDSYKSASTDCLSKAASQVGIADMAFKGEISEEDVQTHLIPYQAKDSQKILIARWCRLFNYPLKNIKDVKFDGMKMYEIHQAIVNLAAMRENTDESS